MIDKRLKLLRIIDRLGIEHAFKLREIKGSYQYEYVTALGQDSINDGLAGDYYWDENSLEDDNRLTVLKPDAINNDKPGRWIRVKIPITNKRLHIESEILYKKNINIIKNAIKKEPFEIPDALFKNYDYKNSYIFNGNARTSILTNTVMSSLSTGFTFNASKGIITNTTGKSIVVNIDIIINGHIKSMHYHNVIKSIDVILKINNSHTIITPVNELIQESGNCVHIKEKVKLEPNDKIQMFIEPKLISDNGQTIMYLSKLNITIKE